ncbi:universal bacterial protein YeaZ [Burkholderiales bacterium JOSHI_001]|nr:universal bacterial protein YeaZ [Burkholderiales bacterium JOSHI_001]
MSTCAPPCLLAIDTATEWLSVGLLAPAGRWVRDEPGGALASARLLPLVRELMQQASVGFEALDAIAFGQGPGAFTGLRTACSVAQGLAFGAGCPVLALDSLQIVADGHAPADVPTVWVAMDARMDEVYAGHYRRDGARWQVLQAPALYTVPALSARWRAEAPAAVLGSAVTAFADRLPLGTAHCVDGSGQRADALLRLAQAAWEGGAPRLDAAQALPLYLRDKVALTTAEREAARAAA